MSEPLVSVVLPTHNGGRFLPESLASIREQLYRNIELIVVDDGSTDDTRRILNSFRFPNLRVLHQRNEGVGASINKAISNASGDIIVLHTSDDISHRERVTTQVQQLRAGIADIVTCSPLTIDKNGHVTEKHLFPTFSPSEQAISSDRAFARLFVNGNFLCAPAAAFRKEVHRRVGFAHAGLMQLQDFDYWLRCAAIGFSFFVDREQRLAFRWHGDNLSSEENNPRTLRELSLIYRQMISHMTKQQAIAVATAVNLQGVELSDGTPLDILIASLCVKHRLSIVRQIGYELFIEIIRGENGATALERCTNLTRRMIFDLVLSER